jgi:transglutaminase-like putative cysteine protease
MASRLFRIVRWLIVKALYAGWVALMIAVPLFGFWLASSLAAFDNAPMWLALVVGLLLFPIAPVGWELFGVWRASKRESPRKPFLTGLDRLVLRTLIVNAAFLGVVMWRVPHTAFRALAVRGDWMLDGHDGPYANQARDTLLAIADDLEHRWPSADADAASKKYGTSTEPPPPPPPPEQRTIVDFAKPIPPKDPNGWPLRAEPDAIVTAIPDSAQTSVDSVGKFFAEHISDKRVLVKALHDYVVLRLHYDIPTSELTGAAELSRPSQQADDVFAARTGVCEGYARLMQALGKAAGLEVAFITGVIRDAHRNSGDATTDDAIRAALDGNLHAWNAVKIDGQWLLVDTTWDDPVDRDGGRETLRETYLFTPPALFALDHRPTDDAWQLLAKPMSIGEFARQPLMRPEVGVLGLVLEEPTRSQVTAENGAVTIVFGNPWGAKVTAEVVGSELHCGDSTDVRVDLTCAVPPGQHEIRIFGAKDRDAAQLDYVGSVMVNER